MKKNLLSGLMGLLMFAFTGNSMAQLTDSISMGSGYANDVYYSFYYGEVKTEARDNWDIAFYSAQFSAGIITNGGSGVMLYTWPNGDTTNWNTVDTSGLSGWPVLYNSIEYWEDGAFNRSALGHPDYGWGIYNMVNHSLTGDSIYIIKTVNGEYKKLWIEKKISIDNKYIFRYADLDHSNEVQKEYVMNDYLDKNFAYYSFETEELIDREPPKDQWDIVMTKYIDPMLAGFSIPTGFLSNVRVAANKFEGVPLSYDDYSAKAFDTVKAGIGYNWKEFDMGTFTYTIVDSLVYFVQDYYGDVYKLYFESFEMGTGKTVFVKENLYSTDINEEAVNEKSVTISPNPVKDDLRFLINSEGADKMEVHVYDLTGKELIREVVSGEGIHTIHAAQLTEGLYFLVITSENDRYTEKFIVRK